jgi:hypothetical protein
MKATDIKNFLDRMFNEMFSKDSRKDSRHLRSYIYNEYEAGNISISESSLYDILDAADNY